jgi:hypothetical protein
MRTFFCTCLLLLTLALAACGGGEEATTSAAPGKVGAAARSVNGAVHNSALSPAALTTLPTLPTAELLDWAETTYPEFFPGRKNTQQLSPYEYRHYPETGYYVGVAGEDVFLLGTITNNQIQRVGGREDFRCRVRPQDCVPPSARAGWVANLSTLAHGVSGRATIVDSRTIRITGFRYDGTAPLVYAYLGRDNSFGAFAAGRAIGAVLQSRPYVNETLELQLPEGQTLDDFNALSIWCVQFRVNFGSGMFAPPAQ